MKSFAAIDFETANNKAFDQNSSAWTAKRLTWP